jgi:hypothetical protein
VGSRAGLDGRKISSPPGFDPGPSSPYSVAIPTKLPGLQNNRSSDNKKQQRYSHFHKLGPLGYFAMGINSERASSFSHRSVTLVEDLSVDHNSHKTVAYRTSN